MTSEKVASALLDIGAVRFQPDNPITFKSGIKSPVYVDNRTIPYHPNHWQTIIQGFQQVIADNALDFDIVGGIATGGIPHSAALSYAIQVPSIYVRKEAKEHGTTSRVEGGAVTAKKVLLVEDMITTGGSSLNGAQALLDEGANVKTIIAIISYGFKEAYAHFDDAGINLLTLTTFPVVLDVAKQAGSISSDELDIVQDWFDDPHGWAKRHEYE